MVSDGHGRLRSSSSSQQRSRRQQQQQEQQQHLRQHRSNNGSISVSRSAGNLTSTSSNVGLGILPENRTIASFQNKPGIVCHSNGSSSIKIKNYGMIDTAGGGNRKASTSHESGYSSDYASGGSNSSGIGLGAGSSGSSGSNNGGSSNAGTDSPDPSSLRASPRESADEDSSVVNGAGCCSSDVSGSVLDRWGNQILLILPRSTTFFNFNFYPQTTPRACPQAFLRTPEEARPPLQAARGRGSLRRLQL